MRAWDAAKRAYVVSMGNPKSIAFYGSIFALMIPPNAPLWFDGAIVAIAGAISVSWYCSVALLFSKPAVRRITGLLLLGLGGRLLTDS